MTNVKLFYAVNKYRHIPGISTEYVQVYTFYDDLIGQ